MAVTMQQYANKTRDGKAIVPVSGLGHANLPDGPLDTSGQATVSLTSSAATGLLMIRAVSETSAVSKALEAQCGIALSSRLQSLHNDQYCVRWMSPDAWLLSCPLAECYAIETALRDVVSGHMAIVNVSGGYTILGLHGPDARRVLMKSTGYDTHPEHLPPGKVVNTTFAKTQVTLRCVSIDKSSDEAGDTSSDEVGHYELIVRRSYSDYVWLWIQQAAAEYGL